MANKSKQRTDAERRLRQCDRVARVIRILRLLMGPGRWDAKGLAQEMECSVRTVHRHLEVLELVNIPIHFDKSLNAYRVQAGFKFPGIESFQEPKPDWATADLTRVKTLTKRVLADMERFTEGLRSLSAAIDELEIEKDHRRPKP